MRQPVDACNHQGLTWMNEVEDGFQLGAALQRRAAALLLAHYSASSRSQRLDLGIEVLIDSRGASISYSDLKSVHFGYACCDMCSLNQYRPKMNTFPLFLVFIPGVILGIPIMNTFTGSRVFKIDPLVQIDIEPAKGAQIHPISAERIADGRGLRFPDDNVAMYLQPSAP